MKNEVLVQSPTRIDFAGGTLDCQPLNVLLSPVTTINGAISLYTSCRIQRRGDKKIIIDSLCTGKTHEFSSLKDLLNCDRGDFRFFREIIAHWMPEYGFHLSTRSQSPVGGGLGGSSSLCVSILKAFHAMEGLSYKDRQLVETGSAIEARILNKPTGTQDYFPPLKGGINIIDYHLGQPEVRNLSIEELDINGNISLFFTGQNHHSGINNWKVIKNFIDGDKNTKEALERIKAVAQKTREIFLKRQWAALPELLKEEFEARRILTENFSSPEIEKLSRVALDQGGEGVHICGAGGGGCVFVWSQSERKTQIVKACTQAGFKHLNVVFV